MITVDMLTLDEVKQMKKGGLKKKKLTNLRDMRSSLKTSMSIADSLLNSCDAAVPKVEVEELKFVYSQLYWSIDKEIRRREVNAIRKGVENRTLSLKAYNYGVMSDCGSLTDCRGQLKALSGITL